MRIIAKVFWVSFLYLIFSISECFSIDKRTDKLYDLCNSTSTPQIYKQILKRRIDKRERIYELRAKSALCAQKRALSAPATIKTAGVSSITPLTVDSVFKLGEVYCYPNPAKKINPTFHIETGLADKVELKIYDTSGDLVHETVITGIPQVIDDGQGPQYAYEYLWDTKKIGSGVYVFVITSTKSDKTLRKSGRCAVIK